MFPKLWGVRAAFAVTTRTACLRTSIRAALRCGFCALAVWASCFAGAASARKGQETEIDTEHLFGFTVGSDIGEKGEKELENETSTLTGKNGGTYAAVFDQLEAKYTVAQNFDRCGGGARVSQHQWGPRYR